MHTPPNLNTDRLSAVIGVKIPPAMRTAVFDEAARRTRIAGEYVSAGSIIREAIGGHLARLSRSRTEVAA